LSLPEEAVVDEDACELVADGFVDEGGGDGGVDSSGESADDAGVADLLADALHLFGDDVAGVPVTGEAGGAVQEVLDDALTVLGVTHFGVPLHAVQLALIVRERGDGG